MHRGKMVAAWLLTALGLAVPFYLYSRAAIPMPHVHVRWAPGVDARERAVLEKAFQLTEGEFREGRTWSYRITNVRRGNIAALVANPRVEDTDGIDPRSLQVAGAPRALAGVGTALSVGFGISTLVFIGVEVRRRKTRSTLRILTRLAPYVAAICLGVLFLVPLLIDGPYEEEEATLGIFASQLHYQALRSGHWLFWLNDLGFGTPLPIGSRLDFHPAFALAAVASLRVTLSVLWLTQIAVMIVYFLRLAAATGIRAPVRVFLLVCYVFSVVTVCYFYANDWVTHVVGWTLYPVLVFYLRQAVMGDAVTDFWVTAVRLAVLFGFWFLNSHPGYIVPVVLPLVIYVVAAAPARRTVYLCLAVSFVLFVAICAERLYFFATEMRLFPASLLRANAPGLHLLDYAAAAAAPLTPVSPDMRQPFIGVGLGLATLACLFSLRRIRDPHVRACAVAVVASLILSLLPPRVLLASLLNAPAGTWYFRDTLVFFGLLTGGLVLQRWFDSPRWFLRGFAWMLVIVQVLQQSATVLVGYREYEGHRGILAFYRYQGQATGLGRVLTEGAKQFGPRLYLSERAQSLMSGGALSAYGVHFSTDLVFLGLNPVNAWFKSVSMDPLYPSWALMNGVILGERDVLENRRLLDALGINMVLMTEAEDPIPSGLEPLHRMRVDTLRGQYDLVLLGNPNAWPRAVLMAPAVRDLVLPRRPACSNDAALCREFGPLVAERVPGDVQLTAQNGRYTIRLPPAEFEREVFISATYRPDWRATSPVGVLRVDRIAGAFIGVTIPPHLAEVDIAFIPRIRIALTWFSAAAMLLLVGALVVMSWWQWSRRWQAGTSQREASSPTSSS